jgi:hypothetical protein
MISSFRIRAASDHGPDVLDGGRRIRDDDIRDDDED